MYGEFNFSATPLAPPSTKIGARVTPSVRRTWELNGEVVWCVGLSLAHYRCVHCYFPRTKTPRDCDAVTFFPTSTPFPEVKLTDHLKQEAGDIINILTLLSSTTTPSLVAGDPVRNTLLTLATQLNSVEPIPMDKKAPVAVSPKVETPTLPTHSAPSAAAPRLPIPPL